MLVRRFKAITQFIINVIRQVFIIFFFIIVLTILIIPTVVEELKKRQKDADGDKTDPSNDNLPKNGMD